MVEQAFNVPNQNNNSYSPFENQASSQSNDYIYTRARVAVYDDLKAAPRVVEINPLPTREYIEALASQTYTLAQQAGGSIPYTVIREVSENFIHADFNEPVISILDHGNTISFADQGPGIRDKAKVQLPGYSSATSEMKNYIRGVGSGLPIVREYLSYSGGELDIDDNVKDGTVITISLKHNETPATPEITFAAPVTHIPPAPVEVPFPAFASLSQARISQREEQVMRLFTDHNAIGPTDIKNVLGLSLGTAARTLDTLESSGFIVTNSSKKRVLTEEGYKYLKESYGLR